MLPSGDPEPQDHATFKHLRAENHDQDKPPPQPLNIWAEKILRLVFGLIIPLIALLFAVFGVCVFQADGDPAGPGSIGAKLFKASQNVRNSDSLSLAIRHSVR